MENEKNNNNPPVFKAMFGPIRANVWNNNDMLSISIENNYKDKDSGEWKSTSNIFPNDIPKLIMALESCYSYIFKHEKKNV